MWVRRLAWGAIALVILNQTAFAGGRGGLESSEEIGERFIEEYQKNYPAETWELIGTAKLSQPGVMGRSNGSDNIRVYFKRASENALQSATCMKTREKDWVCEVGQKLPEGSLVLR
jgi:hypothetical protein